MQEQYSRNLQNQDDNESEINIIEIVMQYTRHWKWFLLSIILSALIVFLYLRYTTPVYNISSSVILKESKNRKSEIGLGSFEDLGIGSLAMTSNVDNEIFIFKSRSIIRTVINRLNLHTSYIVEGRIKEIDLYTQSPWIVSMEQTELNNLTQNIHFSLESQNEKRLSIKGQIYGKNIDTVFTSMPAILRTPAGTLSFTPRLEVPHSSKPINVTIQHPDAVIKEYITNLSVEPASKTASVLNLSIRTPYKEKGKDFLNTLVETYNNETIEDNRMEASNTQKFINERIVIINRELSEAESDVEDYKRSQGMTDLQADLQRNIQMGSQYEQQLVEVETQLGIVRSLGDYVRNPQNANRSIPANVGVEDPTLAATTTEYNRLIRERDRLSQSMTEDNPTMRKLDEQISGLRQSINASIQSVQQGLAIRQRDVRNQAGLYGGRMSALPKQEREFMELSREQQIKASLFLMLLQKREENALALAATANKAKVLNEAASIGKVAPKTAIIALAGLILALLIPVGIIYLLDLLQYKITSLADVQKISKVPLLGDIPFIKDQEHVVITSQGNSEIEEAFRMLRTKLMLTLGANNRVALFTSTVPGEGKTFVSLNTSLSFALLNKKVLLIGLDIRIPRLIEYLNLETKEGITTFLSGFESDIRSLIVPSNLNDNLFILPAGPIPPNPAELLSRQTLDDAIVELKKDFDYIFIDTPPVSAVADTSIINRVSTTSVYVCRADYSSKGNLRYANNLHQNNQLNNMLLVVNGVKDFHRGYGYGYGYSYGYSQKKKK